VQTTLIKLHGAWPRVVRRHQPVSYARREGSSELAATATAGKAPVKPHRDQWIAEVDHPAGAEFVSLRTSVSDQNGVTAAHTIIHAYELRN
jgi:hypothetical protein